MNAKEKLLLVSLGALLAGCPGSPCTGEFVSADGACAPGCPGLAVLRVTPACETAAQTWCAPQQTFDTESHALYWLNTETGDVYLGSAFPDPDFHPDPIRRATSEERVPVDACLAP